MDEKQQPADWRDTGRAMSRATPVRIPLEPDRSASRRALDERVFVRFPAVLRAGVRLMQRLPLQSRLRRTLLARLFRRGFAATSRGDHELALVGYAPDCEIHVNESAGVAADLVGVHRGHGGWHHVVEGVLEVWEFKWEPEEVLDCGDRAVVTLRLETRGKGSSVPLSHRVFEAWTWRDGLVVRQEIFGVRQQALEAVGLRE
jgi:ketosteroid isomerase-like protein